jgi:hypothetical protein
VESWLTGSALDETRRRALRMLRAIDAGNQIGRRERAAVSRLGRSSLSVGILLVCAVAAAVLLVGPMAWAALPTVQTFTSVGESTFIVPDGVSHVSVAAIGAQGGAGYEGGCYADGAEVTGTLAVTAGETLYVEVGGQGQARAARATRPSRKVSMAKRNRSSPAPATSSEAWRRGAGSARRTARRRCRGSGRPHRRGRRRWCDRRRGGRRPRRRRGHDQHQDVDGPRGVLGGDPAGEQDPEQVLGPGEGVLGGRRLAREPTPARDGPPARRESRA